MAKFNNGYSNIKVKLLNFDGENFAKECYEFAQYGLDRDSVFWEKYDKNSRKVKDFLEELVSGLTFPKYAMLAKRVDFSIEGISRICLAQLTRDCAYFCSESHGLRPLTQEFNIPMNMYNDESIMKKLHDAQKILESAYVEACEKEIPFPESRYLCLHAQTISLTASYTPFDFARSCKSRTNNSFCDELNYVYRKMYHCLESEISKLSDENSKKIWSWLINKGKCIDDGYYTRTNVFNGDFSIMHQDHTDEKPRLPAQNDWRKSCWKMELERIYKDEPFLLTDKEKETIKSWIKSEECTSTYESDNPRSAKNSIKNMYYYEA